jgi:signal transduction histidine kinase
VARHNGLSSDATQRLDESASEVRTSIKALRSLLVEIYPPNLAEEGVRSALADLLARAETRGVTTRLDVDGLHHSLPDAAAALVYRATQEGLRNVLSHANASVVNVRVSSDSARVVLDVEDDGVGFHPDASAAATGHIGLRGLSDLVTDAGGVVEVHSSPGAGTRLHVEVPVA